MNEQDARRKLEEAIASSPYRWRTARGVSKDAGVPYPQATLLLERSDQFVRARRPNSKGEALYTTKKRYKTDFSLTQRIIGAITNKIPE